MVNGYSLDPHPSIKVVTEQYAVVRIPRIKRERVAANNVEIMADLKLPWKIQIQKIIYTPLKFWALHVHPKA